MARQTTHLGQTRQLQALASPVRHRIIAAFEALGRASAADIARRVGMPPESLYHHLKRLRRVGLIVECGRRKTSRRDATLYEVASRDFEVDVAHADDAYLEAYAQMGSALIRWADRCHRAAVHTRSVRQNGPQRERTLVQFHARLDAPALAEVNRRLDSIEDFVREAESSDATQFVITCVLAPVSNVTDVTNAPRSFGRVQPR